MDKGEDVAAWFIDFSKAFDKVDHKKLVLKLRNIGVSQQIVTWVEDFLRNRTQAVVVDGHSSSPCPVTSGVPQGSVVGPILFLIYINDLPNAVKSNVRLFADNTVIYNTVNNKEQLQQDLKALEDWEMAWRMEFNPIKCEHIRFSRKRTNAVDNSYTLHNITMPITSTVKYLGVKLEGSLQWNENTSYVTSKASGRLGYIRRTIPSSLPHLRDKAYKQLLRPTLEYASAVWDTSLTATQERSLEAVQRRAARMVNNIRRTDHTTSTTQLISDLDWNTLRSRREDRRLGMFRAMHFNEVATNISDFITPHNPAVGFSRRHNQQYLVPHCKTKFHQKSFFVSTAKLWNQLLPGCSLLEGPPVAG